jgi:hypothetical protein
MKAATDRRRLQADFREVLSLDAAREEAQQRQHQDDNQDDPENAQRIASFRVRAVSTAPGREWLRVIFLRST